MEKLLMKKSRLKGGKMEKTSRSLVEATSAIRNENEFLLVDFPDIPGPSNAETNFRENLTMKEYEEQFKKLQAENFNLKLKMYLVEERLSKVHGINDKEELIKTNIQLKVTYESQLKELEHKQELLFEASKAFEVLQKEHKAEVDRLLGEKERELTGLKAQTTSLEENVNELQSKMSTTINRHCVRRYENQISELEKNLREEEKRCQELASTVQNDLQDLSPCHAKLDDLERELEQRILRMERLVEELEKKEHDLASANFTLRKLEEEMITRQRDDEILKERLSEKNQTIETLQSSLTARGTNIDALEKRLAKEKSTAQSLLTKLDTVNFLNITLKEELETLQSRLRRNSSSSYNSTTSVQDEETYKKKLEDLQKTVQEREEAHLERLKDLQRQISEKSNSVNDVRGLTWKYQKLEEDHRKACAALKTFMKRTTEDEKEREALNKHLKSQEETIASLKSQLERFTNTSVTSPQIPNDEKLWPLVASLFKPLANK